MALAKETFLEPTDSQPLGAKPERMPRSQPAADDLSDEELRQVFARDFERLRGVARKYVSQKDLARGAEVDDVALEVVSETFAQAHGSRHTFRRELAPSGEALGWLYRIAARVVIRRACAKAECPEVAMSSLGAAQDERARGDEEVFEHLARLAGQGRSEVVQERAEAEASLDSLLALVSSDDAAVLRLAYEEDLDGKAIARRLGITYAAARQRLSRALGRLKRALEYQESLGSHFGQSTE